jgi:hypothetical protein
MTHHQLFFLVFILAGFLIFTGSLMAVAVASLSSGDDRRDGHDMTNTH